MPGTFDVVLCMGPLYHLVKEKDRHKCISESLRVLKDNGLLFIAYINKYFAVASLTKKQKLKIMNWKNVINSGYFQDEENGSWYFSSSEEINSFMKGFKVEKVDHLGIDGISNLYQDEINNMDEKEYINWLDYHFQTCRIPSIMGYSNHGLYICSKRPGLTKN